jgi:acetyltransferase
MPAVKSVSALETGVDLAVIATPIATVPDIVRQCVEKKVAGAIVISAGGKEVGEKGRAIEEQIRATAMPADFVSWGRTAWGSSGPA